MGGELILVDCGFTLKQAETRLARIDVRPADLSAILVTHEHSDHAGGVAALAYKYAIPVLASYGTLKSAGKSGSTLLGKAINTHSSFTVGSVEVQPVIVPHDAREPIQFVFTHMDIKVGVISDLGCITPFVVEQYQELNGLLMESNYDFRLLSKGRYPERVKRRIASNLGHLSNEQAAGFLDQVAHPQLRVVVGHISEENNHLDLLEENFASHGQRVADLVFATQDQGVGWVEVDGFSPRKEIAGEQVSQSGI
jgi:phosphoribosyl 1,2-cyclic phosphodiesterase